MAARVAIIAFAATVLALSSPATAQVGGTNVAAQQQTIDEIEAELASLEAAARWDGDPCAKIHRGASKLDSRFAFSVWADHASPPGEFSSFPPEMVRGWRARVARLLKICPDETGFIGDPQLQSAPRPQVQSSGPNAGMERIGRVGPGTAVWRNLQTSYVNRKLAELEAMPANQCDSIRAELAGVMNIINSPIAKMDHSDETLNEWRARAQRLFEICQQHDRGTSAPRAIIPINIFGGGAQQQAPSDAGNPIREGLNIFGGGNRQAEQDRGAQNPRQQQAAPEGSKRQRSRARPKRDRQSDRCDRAQGQVPADCPDR